MTADDLPAAFAAFPRCWADVLPGWIPSLQDAVIANVKRVSGARPIAPPDPFRALRLVPPSAVKVVVFGQDPYPTAGHADGLAFSAGHGKPRSLARIFEVLAHDRPGFMPPEVWTLDPWAHQGVLLLNPVLTVEIGRAGSHENCGWQALTCQIVQFLCRSGQAPMFLLWGSKAQDFFRTSVQPGVEPRSLMTRHPSYDLKREFMASSGSHFAATRELVDWWAVDRRLPPVL